MRPANRRAPKAVCLPLLLLSLLLTQGRLSAQVTVTPAALDFGVLAAGQTKDLTVTCAVSRGVTVDALTITGANASQFQILSQHFAVSPAASSVVIRFTQTAAAGSAAILNIPYHHTGSTDHLSTMVPLGGPLLSLLDFGAIPFGQTKDLTYMGTLTSNFFLVDGSSLAITGANAGDFQIVSQDFVGKKASVSQSVYSVVVRFNPTAGGTRSAVLELVTQTTTPGGGFYSTVTVPLTGVVTGAPPVAVSGLVSLEGVPDFNNIASAACHGIFHAAFRIPGTKTVVYGADFGLSITSIKDQGRFTIPGVPPGVYDVTLQGWKNLRVLLPNVSIYGPLTLPLVTLPGGDANGDNHIDSSDFGVLIGAFNTDSRVSGGGYDGNADFNYDGVVDSSDFGILIGNYNNVGAP